LILLILSLIEEGLYSTPTICTSITFMLLLIYLFYYRKQENERILHDIIIDIHGIHQKGKDNNLISIQWNKINRIENNNFHKCIEVKDISDNSKIIKIYFDYNNLTELINNIIDTQLKYQQITLPVIIRRYIYPIIFVLIILFIGMILSSIILYNQNINISEQLLFWIFAFILISIILSIDNLTAIKYIKITDHDVEIKKGVKINKILFSNIKDILFYNEHTDNSNFLNLKLKTFDDKVLNFIPDERKDLIYIYQILRYAINLNKIMT
jgi:hypothetical protein